MKALGCYFWEVWKVLNLPKKASCPNFWESTEAGQAREVSGVFEPLRGGGADLRRIMWWDASSRETVWGTLF